MLWIKCATLKRIHVMDSLSQIVLGAAVGEASLGRRVGNKAALWGAVLGTIPDLDVLPSRIIGLMDPITELEVHRGFSHSLLFCILLAPVAGWLLSRAHRREAVGFWPWTWMAFFCLFTHPILDCFTTWGTQLFWPLETRIAWKTVFVVDPLYTVPFLLMLILALRLPRESAKRRRLNYIGIGMSSLYLLISVINKNIALGMFENSIKDAGIKAIRFDARPTFMNTILWTSNVETEDGFYIGYRSFLDEGTSADFRFFPKNHELLEPYKDLHQLKTLFKITRGYYTVERKKGKLVLNDLRFGLVHGINGGEPRFAFAFEILDNEGDLIVKPVERDPREGRKYIKAVFNRLMAR